MKDCVATAPTPASANGTSPPTANQCDCTATPISPVAGSNATIENVCTGRNGLSPAADGEASWETANVEPAIKSRPTKMSARRTMKSLLTVGIKQRILIYRTHFPQQTFFCQGAAWVAYQSPSCHGEQWPSESVERRVRTSLIYPDYVYPYNAATGRST